jgi:hypothetical protein
MGRTSNSYLNLTISTNTPIGGEDLSLSLSNKFSYGQIVPDTYIESLFSPRTTKFKFGSKKTSYYEHTDAIYQTNPSELIRWSNEEAEKSMRLTAADFAYLKDIGVYPNNRIIIARRFPGPVGNDLSAIKQEPIATLISWVKDDSDFFNITYGEEWENAKASFETVLNNVGKGLALPSDNLKGMANLGSKLAGGDDGIPFPGLIEGLQYKLFEQLGYVDENNNNFIIPNGDPNLIRQAKQRSIVGTKEAGSGLKCSFSIAMTVEYEMKFINGVDPTIVYFDIIANALSFGTSQARFMFNDNLNQKGTNFINNLMDGNISNIKKQLENFITNLKGAIEKSAKDLTKYITEKLTIEKTQTNTPDKDIIGNLLKNTVGAVIGKYKVALIGVLNSITGAHSTPWHVTIGNPKKPLFSSGDLYTDDVKMTMGPVLGFNDLPSSIKLEFILKPARNLGADEIFNRFNTGQGRNYVRAADIWSDGKGGGNGATSSTKNSNDFDDFSALNNFGGGTNKTTNQFNNTDTTIQRDVKDIIRQSGNSTQAGGVDNRGRLTGRQGIGGGLS